jgi:hypothetical protein
MPEHRTASPRRSARQGGPGSLLDRVGPQIISDYYIAVFKVKFETLLSHEILLARDASFRRE